MDDLVSNWIGALATTVDAVVTRAFDPQHPSTAAAMLTCTYFRDVTVGQLGEVLGLTGSGAVRLVDRLESEGLVQRRAQDGRTVVVRLTAAGRALARRLERNRLAGIDDLVDVLDAGERRTLARLLDKMLHGAGLDARTSRTACRFCDHAHCDGPHCPVGRSLAERGEPQHRAGAAMPR